jgi:Phage-like element PBSX protein XtrA
MELKGSFAVVMCEGKARLKELPNHGETKIVTHQGKVKRVKFDEGEESCVFFVKVPRSLPEGIDQCMYILLNSILIILISP